MGKIEILSIITVILIGFTAFAVAQKKSDTGRKNGRFSKSESRITYLSQTDLDKATQILYATGSGSLPPEYQYDCKLTVEKENVRLTVHGSYGNKQLYDQTFSITEAQWNAAKEQLMQQKVGNNPKAEPKSGGKSGGLIVYAQGEVLFKAFVLEGLVCQGNLKDAFMTLLPEGQPREILRDPSIFLEPSEEE